MPGPLIIEPALNAFCSNEVCLCATIKTRSCVLLFVLEEGWGWFLFLFLSVKTPNLNSSIYITKYLGGLLYLTIMITLFLKLNIFVIPRNFISLWRWVSLVETFTQLNDKASLPLPQSIALLLKPPSKTLRLRHHSSLVRGDLVHEEMQTQRGSRNFCLLTHWLERKWDLF